MEAFRSSRIERLDASVSGVADRSSANQTLENAPCPNVRTSRTFTSFSEAARSGEMNWEGEGADEDKCPCMVEDEEITIPSVGSPLCSPSDHISAMVTGGTGSAVGT